MLHYYRWFMQFWRQHKAAMTGVVLLTILTTAAKTALPIVLVYAIDTLAGAVDTHSNDVLTRLLRGVIGTQEHLSYYDAALRLTLVYLVFALCTEVLTRFLPLTRALLNLTFAAMMRNRYYDVFTRRNSAFFRKFRTGDLASRLTDDIDSQWDRLAWYSCSGIMRPLEGSLILGLTLTAMLTYSWELTLWSFLPLPFLVFMLARTEDNMVRATDAKQQSVSECYDALEACFSGIRVVRDTMSEPDQLQKYDAVLERRVEREKRFLTINQSLNFLSMMVNHAGTVIVIFVGSYLTINNRLTLGQFLLFIMYLERLVEPLWTLSWFYASSKQVFRYVDRLRETEAQEYAAAETDSDRPAEPFRSLDVQSLSFRYLPESDRTTLVDVSFSVRPGELIAVVGPVGAGKTTLLELLVHNLQPTTGRIMLNGCELGTLTHDEIARCVGYIRQETVLFSETVSGNLTLGDHFGDSDIRSALETSMLADDIERFPQGLNTLLGQRGLSLSGGQRQRLSIARTLLRRPGLVLMDDCTAAMDADTEARFWAAFKREMPGTACIIVTHRMATARQADRVLVLEQGRIVGHGTHEELTAHNSRYRRFMQHQAEEDIPAHP